MPPDGLKVRLHDDVIFALDEDTIENRMFVENARTLIKAESSSATIFVSSLFINGDNKVEEDNFAQWFGKFVKKKTRRDARCRVVRRFRRTTRSPSVREEEY